MKPFVPVKLWIALTALLTGLGTVQIATAENQDRESLSTAGYLSERPQNERRNPETLKEFRSTPRKLLKKNGLSSSTLQDGPQCCDYWIYDTITELFDDFDGDGYYTYLRVIFDVDTYFSEAEVYANLYLARSDEPWSLYYETDVFTLFGSSGNDDYEVETELVSGYPPGYYDVLIEVYDAYTSELVISYGPSESTALSLLPIESVSYDTVAPVTVIVSDGHGGGGTLSFAMIFWLMVAGWAKNQRDSLTNK